MSNNERQNYIIKLADQDVFQIGDKQFTYRKVSNREFDQLERLKLDMRKETDPEKGSQLIDRIMRTSAKVFFGMNDDDYDNAPREELGYAIEAATYRSIYGRPFLSGSSTNGSGSKDKSKESAPKPQES